MLEKRIALTDRFRLDLRAEAFNALNRTNFNLPGATLGAAGFGVISSARPARTMPLSVRLGF
jgi:hypothetical protein